MKYSRTRFLSIALVCCAAAGCSTEETSTIDESFTIIMIPDTQNMVDFRRQRAEGFALDSSEIFIEQMQYIASRGVSNGGDVAFVASVGDVWQHVTSNRDPAHVARGIGALENVRGRFDQWIHAEGTLDFEIPKSIEGYQIIDEAGIPFGVAPGNHDYDAWWPTSDPTENRDGGSSNAGQGGTGPNFKLHIGGLNNFRTAFGSDTDFFRDKDWYVASFMGGGSSAQVFSAGGYRFLHFAFEMQAGDEVVAWAESVIDQYPGLPTIISTHDYLSPRGERLTAGAMDLAIVDPEHNNSAEELWQDFISKNDQIFMVLSGHQPGQALRVDDNDYGNEVYQILADFQVRGQAGLDAGQPLSQNGAVEGIGDGWLREMTFHLSDENPRVEVKTYSSHYDTYSSQLETYAEWYGSREQPNMTDEQFEAADEFTIGLDDFHSRFGEPRGL